LYHNEEKKQNYDSIIIFPLRCGKSDSRREIQTGRVLESTKEFRKNKIEWK